MKLQRNILYWTTFSIDINNSVQIILEIGDFVWKKSDGETFTLNIHLHRYERFIHTNSSSMYSFRGRIWLFTRAVYSISIIFNQQILSFRFHKKSEILMKSSRNSLYKDRSWSITCDPNLHWLPSDWFYGYWIPWSSWITYYLLLGPLPSIDR